MIIVVDGIFFQLAQSGIARLWRSALEELAKREGLRIILLDRGNIPRLNNVEIVPFPSYNYTMTASDSILIQKICSFYRADIFVSTYYTTPMSTPSALVVYDMIPEVLGFDLKHRIWQEKAIAITHSQRQICISENTKQDLIKFYPNLTSSNIDVAYCGVDTEFFYYKNKNTSATVYPEGLNKDYIILVGSRSQHQDYKNCKILFESISEFTDFSFDILCCGGESELQPEFLKCLPPSINIKRVDCTDKELGEYYRNAFALFYPSLYEGFGMPVLESMACGCPVITTKLGSIMEVAGNAGHFISGYDRSEVVDALKKIENNDYRSTLIKRGLRQATKFRWSYFAQTLEMSLTKAVQESRSSKSLEFLEKFSRLREIQEAVDTDIF